MLKPFASRLIALICLFSPALLLGDEPTTTFAPGDAFPSEGLPDQWVRGTAIKSLENGTAYLITLWSPHGFNKPAPGNYVQSAIAELGEHPRLKTIALFATPGIDPEWLDRRLSLPSQQNAIPLADANDPESAVARLWTSRLSNSVNTIVVRDQQVVWAGNGYDLDAEELQPFLTEEFSYEASLKAKETRNAHIRHQLTLISKDYPAALQAKDSARADAILKELDEDPDLHPFIGMRLYDALTGQALQAEKPVEALGFTEQMMERYPNEKSVQSWAHKTINNNDSLVELGQALSARAALRVAQLRHDRVSQAWWRAAADHFLKAGDKQSALTTLEEAEKHSESYQRLLRYQAASKAN